MKSLCGGYNRASGHRCEHTLVTVETMAGQIIPVKTMAGQIIPVETMTGQIIPVITMAGQIIPVKTMAGQIIPGILLKFILGFGELI